MYDFCWIYESGIKSVTLEAQLVKGNRPATDMWFKRLKSYNIYI